MDIKADFSDVLIVPRISKKQLSRSIINIYINYKSFFGLPLIVSNMPSIGTYKIANLLSREKIVTFIYKDYPEEYHMVNLKKMETTDYIGLTTGIKEFEIKRILRITSKIKVGFINLDIANVYGNFDLILKTTKVLKSQRPDILLSVGNICTPEVVSGLVDSGADLIKVGVGSGSACITRSEVGVGVPQFSAVKEILDILKTSSVGIISDGGCIQSGDICKALGAGARFVMLGGMLADSHECDNKIMVDGKTYVNFWGLGSKKQYNLTNPSEKNYRPNEGRNLLIPSSRSILDTFQQIKGALRSVCTYVGTDRLETLNEFVKFIYVTQKENKYLEQYEIKT